MRCHRADGCGAIASLTLSAVHTYAEWPDHHSAACGHEIHSAQNEHFRCTRRLGSRPYGLCVSRRNRCGRPTNLRRLRLRPRHRRLRQLHDGSRPEPQAQPGGTAPALGRGRAKARGQEPEPNPERTPVARALRVCREFGDHEQQQHLRIDHLVDQRLLEHRLLGSIAPRRTKDEVPCR